MLKVRSDTFVERDAYAERFKLTEKQAARLNNALVRQLSLCKSDEARRLILFADANEGKDAARTLGNREQSVRAQKL